MSNKEGEVRRLAAIMFTDIVGYTSMSQNNESLALDLLDEHRKIFRPILATHGGEEIKTIGDSFLVEFRSALDAVRCAVSMQEALAKRNLECTSVRQIQVRIGIHVGDVVRVGNDVYGDTVNLAQRIESSSEPGGVAISAQVYEQVKNKITFPIEKLGEYQLKNVAMPTLLYTIHPASVERKPIRRTFDTQRRFAVLPLVNIGEADEYLADGLTEELISAFSRLPALKVVARTTMMRYKGSPKSISEIGSELKVSSILEGSVR
ncbi:MAG: adenylate/guanylate cyclase domain-containing protein, partial [Nitrososphaerota archaeon]|nr:adenylate/guanylate cyclase domain-containing protein [Nitrososphaerota archaeon]